MKLVLTGGGTGGHLFPIVALVREINNLYSQKSQGLKDDELKFIFMGPKSRINKSLAGALSQNKIKMVNILAGKRRRYKGFKVRLQNFIDIFKIILGTIQSFVYLFFSAPDGIFSKGGYGSLPVVIAGRLLKIPIFIHESDIIVGASNRKLINKNSIVFTSFPETKIANHSKVVFVGNPIRREILNGSPDEAKKFFNIDSAKKVVLIMGGSQGSERINNVVLDILPRLVKAFEVIHSVGHNNYQQIEKEAKVMIGDKFGKSYHLYPFFEEEELRQALAAADIIISRAGSSSIFEIAAKGKPSIIIPLSESAQNHQIRNAYYYSRDKACVVIEESNFTPNYLLQTLKNMLFSKKNISKMESAAKKFARPDAARKVAEYIINYLYQE